MKKKKLEEPIKSDSTFETESPVQIPTEQQNNADSVNQSQSENLLSDSQSELEKESLPDSDSQLPIESIKDRILKPKSEKTLGEIADSIQESTESESDEEGQPSKSPSEIENKIHSETKQNFGDLTSENTWYVVASTSIGSAHLKSKTPCQDSHFVESLDNGWGVAITCDGAGSAINSQIGSKYVAKEVGAQYFKDLIIKNNWSKKDYIPTQIEWEEAALQGFKWIYNSLEKFADSNKLKLPSLACTIIVIIYSTKGLLVAHIGDGRAGFCNDKGDWKPLIVPHKGEEANQTIFITSSNWSHLLNLKMSGVSIPEARVITEKPIAFTLMTDGCEAHSFICSTMDKKTNKWSDPNIPYSNFFNPLIANLRAMRKSGISSEEANEKWEKFIENGTKGLASESDDKTMILGLLE
jgi:hypothetical protein